MRFKVALALIRIGQVTLVVLRHGVDGQVTPNQVFFQRNVGARMEYKAAVTPPILAFGASKGVFVTVLRVEKYREIGAHRFITLGEHLFGRRANDDAVYIGDLDAQ